MAHRTMCVHIEKRRGKRVLFACERSRVGTDVGERAVVVNDEHRELHRTDVRDQSPGSDEGWHSYLAGGAAGCGAVGAEEGADEGTAGAGVGSAGGAGISSSEALGSVCVSAHWRCALRTASIRASQMSMV